MPRSFLVKKGGFIPRSPDEESLYSHHTTVVWPNEQPYPDINLLQQHYLLQITSNKTGGPIKMHEGKKNQIDR